MTQSKEKVCLGWSAAAFTGGSQKAQCGSAFE